METGGLADALREDHHAAAIENQHERQFERPNHLEQPRSFGGISVHQGPTETEWNAAASQLRDKPVRYRGCECRRVAAVRKMHDGAVLGDDSVDEVQVPSNAPQVLEDTSRHEQDDDAARPRGSNGRPHGGVEHISASDGAVVVDGDHGQFHWRLSSRQRASDLPRIGSKRRRRRRPRARYPGDFFACS